MLGFAPGRAPWAPASAVWEHDPMHVDPYIVLGAAVIGFLVGMTGAGGGAPMTPMLILLFGVQPSAAISRDLVAAVLMRPFGARAHLRRRTGRLACVGGGVPVCGPHG